MSPKEPQPKSYQPRQTKGRYALLYGRSGAGPTHMSQSKPSGTGITSFGRSMPCGQYGRADQLWTSRTAPIAPSAIHDEMRWVASLDGLFTGSPVATFVSRATCAMRRASPIECAMGFWQSTAFFLRIAAIEMVACQWSGVAM